MENLPEDVQREIRRHLFKFVEKVRYVIGSLTLQQTMQIQCGWTALELPPNVNDSSQKIYLNMFK